MSNEMRPMLAAAYEPERVVKHLPLIIQPKIDGIRAIVHKGRLLSRSLKPIPNLHIKAELLKFRDLIEDVDGELVVGEPNAKDVFARTSSGVMAQGGIPDFQFHVFDLVLRNMSFTERYEQLVAKTLKLQIAGCSQICVVQSYLCKTMDDILEREAAFIEQGYEGAMLRKPSSQYKFGRSTASQGHLTKIKRFTDAEAVVFDTEELLHNENEARISEVGSTVRSTHKANKRPGNRLGALKCRGKFPSGETYEVDIGSGFTEQQRIELWSVKASLIGRIAKFKYFEVGTRDKPRQAIFVGWRHPDDM